MAYEHTNQYRTWYGKLLRLHSKPYYERFGEGMEQTFNDLLRERAGEERGVFGYAAWIFVETGAGIIKENLTFIIMNKLTKRLIGWAIGVAALLLIPLALTIRDGGVPNVGWNWTTSDFVLVGTVLFGAALAYELIARKMISNMHRLGVALAIITAVLLFWVTGAVGIIGDENPANAFYLGVLLIAFIGSLIARLHPRGMSIAMFTAAIATAAIPVVALIYWPTNFSPGVLPVFAINAFFVVLWAGAGFLLRQASAGLK